MSQAIEILMTEHRLIEKVLGSLATFSGGLKPDQEGARERLAQYGEFFREFADRCHHGKEEDRLFVTMGKFGFSPDMGPLAVMLREHDLGREHVRALLEVGQGSGELSSAEIDSVRAHANEFIPLLAAHIRKEDNILYPAAVQTLPVPTLDQLLTEFEAFDQDVMGEGTLERLHALAEDLLSSFTPDMSALASSGGGSPCGG